MNRSFGSAADRNKEPILAVLRGYVGTRPGVQALEVASGNGLHAAHFAQALPNLEWQPSDVDPQALASISSVYPNAPALKCQAAHLLGLLPELGDLGRSASNSLDLIVNINMIHISEMKCTQGLFQGAGKLLKPKAVMITYGPYAVNGSITPQSNVDFDYRLKQSNPSWGLRDVAVLQQLAEANRMQLENMVNMPANNKCLIFRKH